MDFNDKAVEIVIELDTNSDLSYTGCIKLAATERFLAAALRDAYAIAVEDSAKVVENDKPSLYASRGVLSTDPKSRECYEHTKKCGEMTRRRIAQDIRALSAPPAPEGGNDEPCN